MEVKDVLTLAIDRADAIHTYWNLLLGVSTGILGIMAAGRGFADHRAFRWLATVGFVVFAASNLDAILALARLRLSLLELLPVPPATSPELLESLAPSTPTAYIIYHGVLDAVVVACIWLVRWPSAPENPPT